MVHLFFWKAVVQIPGCHGSNVGFSADCSPGFEVKVTRRVLRRGLAVVCRTAADTEPPMEPSCPLRWVQFSVPVTVCPALLSCTTSWLDRLMPQISFYYGFAVTWKCLLQQSTDDKSRYVARGVSGTTRRLWVTVVLSVHVNPNQALFIKRLFSRFEQLIALQLNQTDKKSKLKPTLYSKISTEPQN